MTTIFQGDSSVSPWLEESVCHALLRKPIIRNTSNSPKLAQIVRPRGGDGRCFEVSDGQSSIEIHVAGSVLGFSDWAPKIGVVVSIRGWWVSSRPLLVGEKKVAGGEIIHLEVDELKAIGGYGTGIIGNPINVNQSISVRRIVESLLPDPPSTVLLPQIHERRNRQSMATARQNESNQTKGQRDAKLRDVSMLFQKYSVSEDVLARIPSQSDENVFRVYNVDGSATSYRYDPSRIKDLFWEVLSHPHQQQQQQQHRRQQQQQQQQQQLAQQPQCSAEPIEVYFDEDNEPFNAESDHCLTMASILDEDNANGESNGRNGGNGMNSVSKQTSLECVSDSFAAGIIPNMNKATIQHSKQALTSENFGSQPSLPRPLQEIELSKRMDGAILLEELRKKRKRKHVPPSESLVGRLSRIAQEAAQSSRSKDSSTCDVVAVPTGRNFLRLWLSQTWKKNNFVKCPSEEKQEQKYG